MKSFLIPITVILSLAGCSKPSGQALLPYKNPELPVDARVNDLLRRMTPEEKVGQLLCPLGWEMYAFVDDSVVPSESFRQLQSERQAGMLWATFRADPWTRKTLDNGLTPARAAEAANALQRYAIEHSRLGIPLFFAEEAPHGHMAIGTTVFPTGLGMAATWDEELLESVGQAMGQEIRAQGAHVSYGPVLDLVRDPRWSRVEETFGEDPFLTGELGAAMVRGLGGGRLEQPFSTVATLKHFLAYALPEGGQNGNVASVGPRELHAALLPPFRKAIDAGALSVMTSYNSIDGVPCTSNRTLLTDLLRDAWGFKGFVVSDLYSIEGLCESHFVAPDKCAAARQACLAGVDVDLGGDAYPLLLKSLRDGEVSSAVLDSAVAHVLRLKFAMGLFEHPYVDVEAARKLVRTPEHVSLSAQVARESVTLLKNKDNILPLPKGKLRIAVVGPNADNRYNQLGDYTAPQPDTCVVTMLDGIRQGNRGAEVIYAKGCAVRDTTETDIRQAVSAALRSDVVVAVVGGSSARDFKTDYEQTGAAVANASVVSDMECGEGFDRSSLGLLGHQMKLLKALKQTGRPLVVVYIEGRPLDKVWADAEADALLTAYYPGGEGGRAVADVLFGDYNPAGRLPLSVPRSVGQLPVYYNKKAPRTHDYVELTASPLYPFGYGLSYTSFAYSDLRLTPTADGVDVDFKLSNTGSRDGDEVAQLYVRDLVASTVQPLKQLKRFARVALKAGETCRVHFSLPKSELTIVDDSMQPVFESGDFQIMVGASSADIRLEGVVNL